MSKRLDKVNTLLKKEIGKLIQEEIEIPRDVLVTIIKVDTSVDLRYATVYISVLPNKLATRTLTWIKRCLPHIQYLINRKLVMRHLPRLRFELDSGEQKAAKIEKLLAQEKRFGPRHAN